VVRKKREGIGQPCTTFFRGKSQKERAKKNLDLERPEKVTTWGGGGEQTKKNPGVMGRRSSRGGTVEKKKSGLVVEFQGGESIKVKTPRPCGIVGGPVDVVRAKYWKKRKVTSLDLRNSKETRGALPNEDTSLGGRKKLEGITKKKTQAIPL